MVTAVATITDSLDDIYCLQESQPQERAHLLALLEDTRLHVLLEVGEPPLEAHASSLLPATMTAAATAAVIDRPHLELESRAGFTRHTPVQGGPNTRRNLPIPFFVFY